MCENCKALRRENLALLEREAVLNRRIGVLEIQIDTLRAGDQELKFFSADQVAEYLQISKQSVIRAIKEGALHAIKPERGGQYRISHKWLMDYIVQSEV